MCSLSSSQGRETTSSHRSVKPFELVLSDLWASPIQLLVQNIFLLMTSLNTYGSIFCLQKAKTKFTLELLKSLIEGNHLTRSFITENLTTIS